MRPWLSSSRALLLRNGRCNANVRQQRQHPCTVDLSCQLTLMLCTQPRCSAGEDLPQAVHVLLQFLRLLIVQFLFPLTYAAYAPSSVVHGLERNLLILGDDRLIRLLDGSRFNSFTLSATEELHILGNHFRDGTLVAFVCFELVDSQATFYGHGSSFAQVVGTVLGL